MNRSVCPDKVEALAIFERAIHIDIAFRNFAQDSACRIYPALRVRKDDVRRNHVQSVAEAYCGICGCRTSRF
jgi:hypothetical protein